MTYRLGDTVVVALGGSVLHPRHIDILFLKRLRSVLGAFAGEGKKFVMVVGGGRLSRLFQEAVGKIRKTRDHEKDWVGIRATRLNAELVRVAFGKIADPKVIENAGALRHLRYPVTIACGWSPGQSTDHVAIAIAAKVGAKVAIIAGKPAFVYDRDPRTFKRARPFSALTWRDYRKLIPPKWKPGLHVPVDPVAARLAEKKRIAVIVVDGRNLRNFSALLNSKDFKGTIIR